MGVNLLGLESNVDFYEPLTFTTYGETSTMIKGQIYHRGHQQFSWKSLYVSSESVRRRYVGLTDGDAKAALELVFAVVEEGAEDQREGQREQLLFQRCPNDPVTVDRTFKL